jgi:hypothetical protein
VFGTREELFFRQLVSCKRAEVFDVFDFVLRYSEFIAVLGEIIRILYSKTGYFF